MLKLKRNEMKVNHRITHTAQDKALLEVGRVVYHKKIIFSLRTMFNPLYTLLNEYFQKLF